ncbi:MAG: hypothetical protein FIA91_09405 [Geobacter sp.]|nr:hypothetical protein [Geobacter sp.]
MKIFCKHCLSAIIVLILTMFLAACGGSGGSSVPTTTVNGIVMAGPAAGTSVTVKNAGGAVVAGPVLTAADGSYTVAIPDASLANDLIFEATGGTFSDEATSAAGVTLGTFSAHVAAGTLAAGTNVTIDPASTIIRELVMAGMARTAAVTAFNTAFGFTPDAAVKPVFAGISTAATTAQRLAGLRAAAFSQLTKDLGIPAAKQHELILALAEDLADGTLDGLKTGGTAVSTASATAIPADIGNRFANALMTFQTSNLNKSKLTPDKIGAPVFTKKALTANYTVEYLPGTTAAAIGKTTFRIKLANRADGTAASGKTVTLRPYMYMATKSHTTPMESVVDNGDGTYSCTVYYVMSTAMNGVSMGVWTLTVTIDGTESVVFYPVVGMPMGGTSVAKLLGVNDAIMGMAGLEKRTWFLFNDGLMSGMGGSYSFKLFLATKEMGAMLTFPAVKVGDTLKNQNAADWVVNTITVEVSTDKTTWVTATDTGSGHWTAAGLTGLTSGTAANIYVRLTVNGEQKTTDGVAVAGVNGYQTFSITPM